MNILLICFFIIVFYATKVSKDGFFDCFSIPVTKSIKGVAALVVILHHIAQKVSYPTVFSAIFQRIGFLAVTIFFFYSGYGLLKNHRTKEDYCKKFLKKRILPLLCTYCGFIVLYWIAGYVLNTPYTPLQVVRSLFNGFPIVTDSWYIIAILCFYLFFYLLMKAFKKNYTLIVISSLVWAIAWVFLCRRLDYGTFWYNTIISLSFGLLAALIEERLIQLLKKYYALIFICAVSFMLLPLYFLFIRNQLSLLFYWSLELFFIILLLLVTLKIKINSPIIQLLSQILLEFYLVHRLIMNIFRSSYIYIENDLLWSIVVTAVSIMCAFVLNKFFTLINQLLLRPKQKA